MLPVDHWTTLLLTRLAWTSIQALLLAGVVALVVRLRPRLPASVRCALWRLVGLQVVAGCGGLTTVRLPWLAPSVQVTASSTEDVRALPSHVTVIAAAANASPASHPPPAIPTWSQLLAGLWLLGLLAQLPGLMRDRRRVTRWLREACPADGGLLERQCEALARRMGLRRCPPIRVSTAIASPLVTGWMRPTLLWPAAQHLTPEETSLALTHELAHLKRGDLWLGCVPALARWLLFFHPLVRWAVREYAMQREAACDALAMQRHDADPQRYGQLLLRLGVKDVRCTALAGASSTFRDLHRRLSLLPSAHARLPRVRAWSLIVPIAILGVLPHRVVARQGQAVASTMGNAHVAGAATSHDCNAADGIPFCGNQYLVVADPAVTDPTHKGQKVILFDQNTVVIAGTMADMLAVKPLYRPSAQLLWLRRGDRTYVVRSPTILQQADALVARFKTQSRNLDARREAIERLADEQGRLADRQDGLASQLGNFAAEGGQLDALQATLPPARSQQVQARINALQARASALQPAIDALGQQIDTLQKRIRVQQAEFAARQSPDDFTPSLVAGLNQLADDALANGAAQPVHS